MKIAKLANKQYWTVPEVAQGLRGCLLVVCLLTFLVANGSQIQAKTSTWIPADTLTCFALSGNGYYLNKKPLSYQHDKWPNFLFSLGRYHLNVLHYTMVESKNAFQNSNLQLYSFGGGIRKLISQGMVGSYLFIDTTLKDSSSLSNMINLCNLSVGFEGTFSTRNQIAANIYVPLRAHQENVSVALHTDTEVVKNYAITSPYYLESSDLGLDINFGRTFTLGQRSIKTTFGAYAFFDREKTLKLDEILFLKRSSRRIIGFAHKLTWQWNDYCNFHYKISCDTTRPLNLSFGIQWKHSIYNPIHRGHQRLWLPPIERHLAPLLWPEKVSKIEEAKTLSGLYLKKYKNAFKEIKEVQRYKEYCNCLEEVNGIIFQKGGKHLYEMFFSQAEKSSTLRKILLAISPDKRLGDLNAMARYHTFTQEVFPILWEIHRGTHSSSTREEKVIRYMLTF